MWVEADCNLTSGESLTRQILFLLPLIVVFPLFIGIDGILFAGPIADGLAGVVAIVLMYRELKRPEYQM